MFTSRIMKSLAVMRTSHLQPMKLATPLLQQPFLRFQSTQTYKKSQCYHYELHELARLHEKEMRESVYNKMKAFQLYQQAADLGHPAAMVRMADYYALGNEGPNAKLGVVKRDEIQAIQYLQKAADLNYAPAQIRLAGYFKRGIKIEKDELKAFELYKRAADQGSAGGLFNLALCYEEGIGVAKDLEKARELMIASADQNYLSALFYLGVCGNYKLQDLKFIQQHKYKLTDDDIKKRRANLPDGEYHNAINLFQHLKYKAKEKINHLSERVSNFRF